MFDHLVRDDASVLHADLDAFYASVEQLHHPSLRGRPVIVGGGVVLAASYEARAFGIHSGMGGRRARRLCPHAVVVPARLREYGRLSQEVMDVFGQFTPLVEPLSPDEAFLEVAGARRLFGSPEEIASELRRRVLAETGLAVSVGVACTKFLAKVASGVAKPDGLAVVAPGRELAFLHPLPVQRLWGVGPATLSRLRGRGIETVGDLAALPPAALEGLVGTHLGRHLHALGWNHDPRSVEPTRARRSVGSQQALGRVHDTDRVDRVLLRLADRVSSRLRDKQRVARTITVRIRFADDFTTITRSRTLRTPTQLTALLYETASDLVGVVLGAPAPDDEQRAQRMAADRQPGADLRVRTTLERRGISLLGISTSNIGRADAIQLELPFEVLDPLADRPADRRGEVDRAVDGIRDRFGREAIGSAALLREGDPLAPSWHDIEVSAGLG